jgi:hypothetical protein
MSRLWEYVQGHQQLDPDELRVALEEEKLQTGQDWRTRRLILECWAALSLKRVREPKFPSLPWRIRPMTKVESIKDLLRQVGREINTSCRIIVGGSSALILLNLLHRSTEAIDIVDEVPEPLRALRGQLDKLRNRYGLMLAHFQSHYLPDGWNDRISSFGSFGRLEVWLIDPIDIFVGKVFSRRDKDLDDLRALRAHLEFESVKARLSRAHKLFGDTKLREAAEKNWYIVFGEDLPTQATE